MKNLLRYTLFIVFVIFQANCFAWGRKGHEMIMEMAFARLKPQLREKIIKYLDGMTIQSSSTWMDEIRRDKRYNYLETAHYINIPDPNGNRRPSENDIQKELNTTFQELSSIKSLPDSTIKFDLLKIIHLVGDIHQPLHTGYESDRGGNSVDVFMAGKKTNLHRLWDSQLIESLNIDSTQVGSFMNTLSKKQLSDYSKVEVTQWIKESQSYLSLIYKFDNGEIDSKYIKYSQIIINAQLAKAVLRLQKVLETYFGK